MKVKTILVSQPPPKTETSPYFDLSDKQKVKIDFRSFIHVEGISVKEIRNNKVDFKDFTAIILSEAVAYYLQKYVVYRKRKIYVGSRTFLDLTKLIKKHKTENFLLPSSDKLKPLVPEELDKLGVQWTRIDLYRTVVSDLSDLENVVYDVLVFFSPSGIESLFQNFPDFKQNSTRIAAFGNSTVSAVTEAGLNCDIEAPSPETPSMTMALDKYIKVVNKK